MVTKTRTLPGVGRVGEVSNSPKAMQKFKPDPDVIAANKAARAKLSPFTHYEVDMALLESAKYGKLNDVKRLLKAGADVNTRFGFGTTALFEATRNYRPYPELIRILLEAGAEVNATNNAGLDALGNVSSHSLTYLDASEVVACRINVAKLLISAGADVNTTGCNCGGYALGHTALETAAIWANKELLRLLIDAGVDVNAGNGGRGTALHKAVQEENIGIAEFLIQNGADVNARDKHGRTPLMQCGGEKFTELLISEGADVNARSNYRSTALMYAACTGATGKVLLLIDNGADVNARDNTGRTALRFALKLRGMPVEVRPSAGGGLWVVRDPDPQIVELLESRGGIV